MLISPTMPYMWLRLSGALIVALVAALIEHTRGISATGATIAMALILDFVFGDPNYRLHPVRLIGQLIRRLEGLLWDRQLRGTRGGWVLLWGVVGVALCAYAGVRLIMEHVLPGLGWVLDVYLLYSCVALLDMVRHTQPIAAALKQEDLAEARSHLQQIVGRDVQVLDAHAVARATVESVAESFVDGFLAPLFWFAAGGAVARLLSWPEAPIAVASVLIYRCTNTLDSMVGYRNERYLHFGAPSAHFDDQLNFLPARLSLGILWAGARLLGLNAREGWRVGLRDRLKHASPNSAHAESFVAGALELRLGGPTVYPHGEVVKPWMGDGTTEVVPTHIVQVCRLTLVTGWLSAALAIFLMEIFL